MGEAVVSFLVERLDDLLNQQEEEILKGLRDPVGEIIAELRLLQGLLRDAGARRNEEKIRVWGAEVRELVYDATDILENLILEAAYEKKGVKKNVIKGHIKTLNNRISKLITCSTTYGIKSLSQGELDSGWILNRSQCPMDRSYSLFVVPDQEVVGLEGDIEYLIGHLMNGEYGDNCYRVVSICGMGGLGKTTLAGKIYNHPTITRHFDCLSWVCVSRQWQTNDVLQKIFLKLCPERRNEDLSLRDDDELKKLIFDMLRGKRYLVVIDDIWSSDAWDSIKFAFPFENMSSKILLTTRNIEVARHVRPKSLLHQPKLLSEEQSWVLLQKKTCVEINWMDPRDAIKMEKLGREMIRCYRGLPLAILVLGGILATKPTLTQWEIVRENIGTGEGFGQLHQAEVEEMLISSYYDLPDPLKPCFLYLSKFPEDSEIDAERLYQLWMAEGMVLSKDRRDDETLMDVAESYLGELSHRCMLQVEFEEEESSIRKFKSCRLHDLMRDLSLKKAKEEDFFKVVNIVNGNTHEVGKSSSSSTSNYPRRLVISPGYEANRDAVRIIHDKEVGRHLRSLLLTNFVDWEWKPPIPLVAGFHPNNLKFLRVLALEGIEFKFKGASRNRITKLIGFDSCSSSRKINSMLEEEGEGNFLLSNLIQLRYFSLRWSALNLSPSFTGVGHLQTLDLRVHNKRGGFVFNKKEVAIILGNVGRRLQHLYLPRHVDTHSLRLLPRLPLDQLSNLETLVNFDPEWCAVAHLIKLTKIRKLTIHIHLELHSRTVDYLLSSLVSISPRYSSIVIQGFQESGSRQYLLDRLWDCCNVHQLEIHGPIGKLPTSYHTESFSSSLTSLLLFSSKLEGDPMATLERIPNLRSLVLSFNAFLGKEMVCSATGFPQLKCLHLSYLRNLEEWWVDGGAMPNLSVLQIECCNKLEMLPDGFRFLAALRELNIVDMPEKFRYRVQSRSAVDFHKVHHVPCINFRP